MTSVPFAIVGGGWRTDFFLRAARELPERFRVTGVLMRDARRRDGLTDAWGVPGRATLDELLADKPAFVVVATPWPVTPILLRELHDRGLPALAETPPAPDLAGLRGLRDLDAAGARIQVAEQYQFQPLHAARLALAASGKLGVVTEAQVSVAHGYHGLDLLRRFLGVGSEPVTITARRFTSPIVAGPDRAGPPRSERIVESLQTVALLEFDGRLGVFDFTDDQYFSWIRALRLVIRGDRGEIVDTTARYLLDATMPVSVDLVRRDAGHNGNLEGMYHAGITAGEEWLYRSPFPTARLTDDEIAVATCLARMAEYVEGGPAFSSLADAAQDHYLGMSVDRAAETREPVRLTGHVWEAD
jgi:predicted dehydrogenase